MKHSFIEQIVSDIAVLTEFVMACPHFDAAPEAFIVRKEADPDYLVRCIDGLLNWVEFEVGRELTPSEREAVAAAERLDQNIGFVSANHLLIKKHLAA